jgi:hypothetical protein
MPRLPGLSILTEERARVVGRQTRTPAMPPKAGPTSGSMKVPIVAPIIRAATMPRTQMKNVLKISPPVSR